jgi:cysteine-rich repeat protein
VLVIDCSNGRRPSVSALGFVILLTLPGIAWSAPAQVRASSRELPDVARQVGKGGGLVVKGLVLEGETDVSNLELKRHEVWRPNAVVMVDGRRVSPPATAFFKGKVVGDDGSVAMISIRENGEVQGLVQRRGKSWLVGKGRSQKALKSKKTSSDELAPFECGNDDTFSVEERLGDLTDLGVQAGAPSAALDALGSSTVLDSQYVASLAIDTDYEFYAKFGNTTAALDYIADLVGYADLTYSREINTDMQIGYSRLFTGGAASDPWTVGTCVDANGDGSADNSPCGTSGVLGQFRDHWNSNMRNVDRTVAHLLSGKNLGGGIAYIGVLCQNYGSSKGSTHDYGVSASLGGNFRWDGNQSHNPSNVVWDIVVLQHELGHNFNSPHSHDYCDIGGSSLPIDNCASGCRAGAALTVPSCSAPTPFFTTGGGAGTIMSYCHHRSGGYGNIAMTFGEGHSCGTLPRREADRMQAHVVSRAASFPSCFAEPATSGCGNGVLDAGEQCDDGNASNADACLANCRNASCGDGFTRTGVEQCDDGNAINTDACLPGCTTARCGDGFTRAGVEQCDDGNAISTDACLPNCIAARCGDGITRSGVEQCDDGNAINTDACPSSCTTARCGDGFVRASVEQCDDGNALNTDACLANCRNASCGDGFTRAGVEQCDDANAINTDACLSSCTSARCGDGFLRSGIETCDDANASNSDACPSSCRVAFCGDGFTRSGVEQCDDGNANDTDGCLKGCVAAVCGDGHVQQGVEECDDGNNGDADGCNSDCLQSCDEFPRPNCRSAPKSDFRVVYGATPRTNVLKWRWMRGDALDVSEIGDPTISAGYNLCFYPNVPGDGGLGAEVLLGPGSSWSPLGSKGFRYRDSTASNGIAELRVGTGPALRTRLRLSGKGAEIPAGLLPASSFTVQLIDIEAGGCWSSSFATGATGQKVFHGRAR